MSSTDSQQKNEEPEGFKKTKTAESAEEQQGNPQEKSNTEQHYCKTGHLSKLHESMRFFFIFYFW